MSAERQPRMDVSRARATDAELIAWIGSGDLSALGELYDRYQHDLRRAVARALARTSDVDDIVQATFLTVPRAAPSYDGRQRARAWLVGIAVRLALRHQRSLSRLVRTLTRFGDERGALLANSPEGDAIAREELAIFERAFGRLSAKKRAAFVLVELEGLTAEEASRGLDVPPATIRTRVFHAKAELREAMKRGGAW